MKTNMFNELNLTRPLVFIDFESTGLNPYRDRIVELTFLKVFPNGTQDIRRKRINPEISIPSEASLIHRIYDEDVRDKPTFKNYAKSLFDYLENCDIAGFGIKKFDLPILEAEFRRCGIDFSRNDRHIIDALVIFHQLEPRDLAAAYRKYCGKELELAHNSEIDVKASLEVLLGQLLAHPDLPRDLEQLHAICNFGESEWIDSAGKFVWQNDEAVINFGRYQGKTLKELSTIDPEYLKWISSSDFPADTKKLASEAINGKIPIR